MYGAVYNEMDPNLDELSSLGTFSEMGEEVPRGQSLQGSFKHHIDLNFQFHNADDMVSNWQESNFDSMGEDLPEQDTHVHEHEPSSKDVKAKETRFPGR